MQNKSPTQTPVDTLTQVPTQKSSIPNRTWTKPDLTVLQFNCLAESLQDWFDVDPEFKLWERRSELIMEQILAVSPDVIALEEVDNFQDFFQPRLKEKGYKGFCTVPIGKKLGTVLFWKEEKIKLLKIYTNDFQDIPQGPGGFLVTGLLHIETGNTFYASACHLKAKPPFDEVRLIQTNEILKFFAEAGVSIHTPIIMLGDFNGEPNSPFYNLIVHGFAISDEKYKVRSPLENIKFSSAYATNGVKQEPITTVKTRDSVKVERAIDFIFFSSYSLNCIGVLDIPEKKDIPEIGLPSENYGSDHFAIAARFCFTQRGRNESIYKVEL
jgi:mRNA deadenylase 3'-5' endonuclease subunit Ccr4